MPVVQRYWRPSAIVTIGAQIARDINLPPPAPRGPRIAFSVRRTMTSEPDSAQISVFNLAPLRETGMSQLFHEPNAFSTPVTLAAGYGAFTSTLFRGECRTMLPHVRQGPDYALVVTADDGGDALSDLTASYSTAGWTARNMIDVALLAFNTGDVTRGIAPYPLLEHPSVAAAIAAGPVSQTRFYTGVHAGKVRDLLDEACRILRCRWWVADGLLYMAARKLPVDTTTLAVVLPRKIWLDEAQLDGEGVIRLTTLFDPKLVPGRVAILEGRVLPGLQEACRVEAVEVAGDTRAPSPWRSALTLRRISP